MNFTQMHERLRLEMLRRIQRGTLSVSLLARQTGFGQSHVSNFLRSQRHLSLEAMDRILTAQHMVADDLVPAPYRARGSPFEPVDEETGGVPVVSHNSALFEPHIQPSAVHSMLRPPPGVLKASRPRPSNARRAWERFVAVRIHAADALPMDPLVLPEALIVIDRHYNSLRPYRPNRPTLLAVQNGPRLTLRYADFLADRLILRPHNLASPVELIEIDPGSSPNELIVGRVVVIINET